MTFFLLGQLQSNYEWLLKISLQVCEYYLLITVLVQYDVKTSE